jgi:hypothetical protein
VRKDSLSRLHQVSSQSMSFLHRVAPKKRSRLICIAGTVQSTGDKKTAILLIDLRATPYRVERARYCRLRSSISFCNC